MIEDPWGRTHRVNDRYDNDDLIVSPPSSVTFLDRPDDQLSREGFNFNRSSTMERITKDVTLHDMKKFDKISKVKTNW
jgi:hypothetical protein